MPVRKLASRHVVLATHNKGKIGEYASLLRKLSISSISGAELGLDSPLETADTFQGNASIKAQYCAQNSGLPAIADDSGITVNALKGLPGVQTADWAETSTGRNYVLAMTRVWSMLEEINAPEPRYAQFRSTICVAWPDRHEEFFAGTVQGKIVWPMRGEVGFGFDPIFMPHGFYETFGEMCPEKKNAISHRARAMQKFSKGCLSD